MAAIGTGWVDGAWIEAGWVANPGAWEDGSVVTATLSGTIVPSATETELRAFAETLIITLNNDTWVAAGATFDAQRSAIIAGLTSAGVEATGWNNIIRDNIDDQAVVRTSDTVVTITITDSFDPGVLDGYDITADETITVTIPATALVTSVLDITGTPTFDITVDVVVTTGPDILTRGGKRRQRRYPRWVQIDGKRYRVFSLQEEVDLLNRIFAELRAAEAKSETPTAQRKIRKRRVRLEKRMVQVDDSQARWLDRLRKEDEELLLLLH